LVPLLYQSIRLATGEQAGSLVSTLQNHPEKRRLIQSIVITIPPQQNHDDSEQIPAHRYLRRLFQKNVPVLEDVHLLTSTFMSAMTYMKDCLRGNVSLRRITIICHGPCLAMSTSYVWSILKAFPELEEFRFEFTGTDGMKQETLRALPSKLHLSKTTLLSISGIVVDDEIVEELGYRCPNLKQMEINGENRFCVI
jgi:hypothetical protein